jgi:hypothetical protein
VSGLAIALDVIGPRGGFLLSKNPALLFQVAGVSARNSFTHGLKHAELVGAAERNDRAEARRTKSLVHKN